MDASSYLKKHGWQGSGHSLDTTGRGLKKPLLVSKKVDVLGVGLNKHAAVSDQWWLRAYDQGLATLGTGKESALAQAQKHGVNRGGLYGRFVKGEGMPGTVGEEVKKVEVNGMLPTPQDSDAQEEKAESKRVIAGSSLELHLGAESIGVQSPTSPLSLSCSPRNKPRLYAPSPLPQVRALMYPP